MINRTPMLAAVLGGAKTIDRELAARREAGIRAARAGELTAGQRQALEVIGKAIEEQGFSPSLRELAAALGVDRKTARGHVQNLTRLGHLFQHRTADGRAVARTMAVVRPPEIAAEGE
jgi:DNA-binding MarR family transcriptional regulator